MAIGQTSKLDKLSLFLLIVIGILLLAIVLVIVLGPGEVKVGKFPLTNKVWVSYGDSITDGGFWQAAVAEHFSLIHYDHGISGSAISGYAGHAFWQPDRLNMIINQQPDLITIMGGTNDFFSDFPLGDASEFNKPLAEKDLHSFYGAYSYVIESLQLALPNTKIVIMTTPTNYTAFNPDPRNNAGDTVLDYANACAELVDHYGLILVDLRKIDSDQATFNADFWDGIHPNLEGAAKISQFVIGTLEKYKAD